MTTLIAGFDLETTGLDVTQDRIVEVALVVMELETGVERLRYEKRINPGMHIPPKVVEVHGICDADVAKAPSFKEVAPGLVKLLGAVRLLVGHNIIRYDLPLLAHELVRVGVSAPAFPAAFDTMLEGRGCTDDGKVPSLGELCWALDTPYDPELAHKATYDVLCNLSAFRRGWQIGAFQVPGLAPAAELRAAA